MKSHPNVARNATLGWSTRQDSFPLCSSRARIRAVCYELFYFSPLLPIITRGAVILRFYKQMGQIPEEPEQDREGNRALILAFAGFSFTGVIALIVLEPSIKQTVKWAVYFLLVSFLSYLWALNLQGYKASRWQDEIAAGLADAGSLCLILALVSLLAHSAFPSVFVYSTSVLALTVWIVDHLIRLRIDSRYYRTRETHPKI